MAIFQENAFFIGYSMYDCKAIKNAEMDFIFLSKWIEVKNWQEKFTKNLYLDITDLLEQCI